MINSHLLTIRQSGHSGEECVWQSSAFKQSSLLVAPDIAIYLCWKGTLNTNSCWPVKKVIQFSSSLRDTASVDSEETEMKLKVDIGQLIAGVWVKTRSRCCCCAAVFALSLERQWPFWRRRTSACQSARRTARWVRWCSSGGRGRGRTLTGSCSVASSWRGCWLCRSPAVSVPQSWPGSCSLSEYAYLTHSMPCVLGSVKRHGPSATVVTATRSLYDDSDETKYDKWLHRSKICWVVNIYTIHFEVMLQTSIVCSRHGLLIVVNTDG